MMGLLFTLLATAMATALWTRRRRLAIIIFLINMGLAVWVFAQYSTDILKVQF